MCDRRGLRRHRHLWYLSAALLWPVAAAAQADSQPETRLRLFAAEYHLDAEAPVDAATANSILSARMSRLGKVFQLVTAEEARRAMDQAALEQMLGVEQDMATLTRLGQQIQADRLIFGHMGKVGETYVAILTLYDLQAGVVEKRVAGTFRGPQDLAVNRLNEQADQVLAYLLDTYAPDRVDRGRKVAVRLGKKKTAEVEPERWRPGWQHMAGAGLVGLGAGLAAGGAIAHATLAPQGDWTVPAILYGTGGAVAVGGVLLSALPMPE